MPADFLRLSRLLDLSAENRAITNIGNAGTDFTTSGGLIGKSALNLTGSSSHKVQFADHFPEVATENKFTLIQMDAEKSLTKQIKSAVKSNCDILVIVGSEEMSNNILTIKDLRSDREDRSISFDDFSKFIEEY